MILNKKNLSLNAVLLINIIFCFFPICFIFGNLITNINFLLFCCLGIFLLRSKILINKINFPLKIIFLFFLLVLFSTSLNLAESLYSGRYEQSDLSRLIKSILFFRFFIILLIVYFLSELDIINYKYFFLSAAIFPTLISIDIIFQYTFGFNVIGIKSLARHNPSFFGDELISGGYIQNFSFFSILFLTDLIKKNNNLSKIILTTFTICTLAIGIMLSGNRMPFFLFLVGLFLLFFFSKDLKKILLTSCCTIFIIFGFIISFDENMRNHYGGFYFGVKDTTVFLTKKIKNNLLFTIQDKEEFKKEEKWEEDPSVTDLEQHPYKKLTLTAFETWKSNKIFGNGIKSFRVECHKIVEEQKRGLCSTHPHNYYLEVLIDLGIAGIILAMGIALAFIVFLVKNYKVLKRENNLQNLFLLAAVISLLLEVFPFRSTGSIFTTNNTTYIILMSSIILSYKKLLKGKNFE